MKNFRDEQWFTEVHHDAGSAFSVKTKRLVEEKQSPFQLVQVFETTDFGYFMVIDGCTMVSTRENFLYHEMIAHPVMFTHENPEKIAIIGGGDCGTLKEVLKHDTVQSCYQIDIDKAVTDMSEKYFPELCTSNNDPRAHIMFDDGIKFMANADAESFDIIIVDSTDPVGPGEGLFNHAFYNSCLNALKPNGILVQQSDSPLYHLPLITDMRNAMQSVGFESLQTLNFPQPIYPSGWWSCTMAKKSGKFSTLNPQRIERCRFDTQYYNLDIHNASFALPNFVKKAFGIN